MKEHAGVTVSERFPDDGAHSLTGLPPAPLIVFVIRDGQCPDDHTLSQCLLEKQPRTAAMGSRRDQVNLRWRQIMLAQPFLQTQRHVVGAIPLDRSEEHTSELQS